MWYSVILYRYHKTCSQPQLHVGRCQRLEELEHISGIKEFLVLHNLASERAICSELAQHTHTSLPIQMRSQTHA